jgi:hypothetical protein
VTNPAKAKTAAPLLVKPVVELVAIERLKGWARNPRKKHAVEGIASSIDNFGYLNPIVVQKGSYRVLAGHGRLLALTAKGVKQVPVIVADLDDNSADAYTIADNKLSDTSRFDYSEVGEILKSMERDMVHAAGFTDAELAELEQLTADVGDATAVGNEAKNSALYAGGENREAVNNDTTLVVVFDSTDQLNFIRTRIRKLQANNEKSIGQVVCERFID